MKQSRKRRIGWKRQRKEICDIWKREKERYGEVSVVSEVFVFRIWEDEFPWNLGCSIRNCFFFFCSLEEPAARNIRLGMEGRIEIVKNWFSSEISFSSNSEERFPYFIDFCKIKSKHQIFFINDLVFH